MFAFKSLVVLVTVAATVSASCAHGTSLHRRQATEEGKVEVAKFGYSDEQGPLNWAGLDPANSACATSKVQSPIVLGDDIQKATEAPKCDFPSVQEAEFENLGTTLETVVEGTTNFGGKDFKLAQFHLHTPSEHRINDEYFPLEMHMVHEAEDGSIAVIAIPFQLTEDGSTTELLTNVIQNIESVREPGSVAKTGPLDFAELVEAVQTKPLFQYTGSLTTPPCAEGLTFLVMEEPMKLNVKTYNAVKNVIKFNARYSQNKLESTNMIQVASQKSELNCEAVEIATSPSAAVELQEPKAEEPMAEEPEAEEAMVEEPKAEEAMAEEPKAEEPMAEEPEAEEAMAEEPKAEEAMAEEPKAEEAMAEEAMAEEPKAEEDMAEEPKAEEAMAEEPKAEDAMAEEAKAEEAMVEEPKAEEPKAEEYEAEEPKAEEYNAEEPKAEESKDEESKDEESKDKESKDEEPKAEEPKAEESKAEEAPEYKAYAAAPAEEKPAEAMYSEHAKKMVRRRRVAL
jgi:carbonic anhydrase